MVLTTMQSIAIIAVCGICTLLERALPFLIFSGRAVPEPVRYLGRVPLQSWQPSLFIA